MYTFIVNPNARTGLGFKTWKKLKLTLKERGISYRVFFTKYQKHATNIAKKLTEEEGPHMIIALGGDGTVNEVINGISGLSKTTLGYIPIGSSNDFARGMGLSTDPVNALEHILFPTRFAYVNIGVLNYQNKKHRFAVSSGFGFDAGVCHQILVSNLKKILNRLHLGKLSYAGVALQRILALTPGQMTLTLDHDRHIIFDKVYFAAAMNQKVEGGGFKFCPHADPSDDMLDVIVVAGLSKLKVLLLLPTAFKGWHTRFKGVYIYRCKEAEFRSERALPVHTDGEPIFLQRQVNLSLEKEHLRLILS